MKSCERAVRAARARLATNLAFRSQKDASGLGGFPLKSEVLVIVPIDAARLDLFAACLEPARSLPIVFRGNVARARPCANAAVQNADRPRRAIRRQFTPHARYTVDHKHSDKPVIVVLAALIVAYASPSCWA